MTALSLRPQIFQEILAEAKQVAVENGFCIELLGRLGSRRGHDDHLPARELSLLEVDGWLEVLRT